MIKKVLLGLGGTPFTDTAIQRAIELANRLGKPYCLMRRSILST